MQVVLRRAVVPGVLLRLRVLLPEVQGGVPVPVVRQPVRCRGMLVLDSDRLFNHRVAAK